MRILLTGGAGFIGSQLAREILKRGDSVICLDDLSTGKMDNISELLTEEKFEHQTVNLLTEEGEESLKKHVISSDLVFHLAAAVGVFNVVKFPAETIKNNIEITEKVLNFAKEGGTKVMIFSTSEVYGKSTKFPFNEEDDIVLGPSKNARWSYAASKLVDEFLGLAYYNQHNLPVIIVRLFNTVGIRQVGHYGMVIPRFIQQAINEEDLTVFGDGTQSRCFCNVRDTVRGLLDLVEDDNSLGKVFNIGSSEEISIEDLAKEIIRITGSKSRIKYIPYEEAYSGGFEDMQRRVPDTSKIQSLVGWKSTIVLEETIREIWQHTIGESKE